MVGKVALSFVKVGTKKETKKAIPIILSHKRNVKLSRWFDFWRFLALKCAATVFVLKIV